MSLRIKNIALSAWFLLPLDERVREIVVLAAFAPVTIFSTKFTDSLTGNAKLAGFSLTVTAIIGLTFITILHAVLRNPYALCVAMIRSISARSDAK